MQIEGIIDRFFFISASEDDQDGLNLVKKQLIENGYMDINQNLSAIGGGSPSLRDQQV